MDSDTKRTRFWASCHGILNSPFALTDDQEECLLTDTYTHKYHGDFNPPWFEINAFKYRIITGYGMNVQKPREWNSSSYANIMGSFWLEELWDTVLMCTKYTHCPLLFGARTTHVHHPWSGWKDQNKKKILCQIFFFLMVHIHHWGQRSYVKMTIRRMATLKMGSSVGKQQSKTLLTGMKPTRQRHHTTPWSVDAVAEDEHQGANAHKKLIQGWNYLKVTFAFSYFFIALFCVGDANVIQSNLSTLLMLWSLELLLWMEGEKRLCSWTVALA